MRLFWEFIRKHRGEIALGVLFLAITDAAQIFIPLQLRQVLDLLKQPDATVAQLAHIAWTVAGLMILTAVFRMGWRLVIWPMGRQVEYELRRTLLQHLQQLDNSFYHHHSSGDLISRASSDVDGVREFFSMGFVIVFDVLFVVPLSVYMMLQIDVGLTLATAVPILVAPFLSTLIMRGVQRYSREAQDRLGDLSARAQEDISGARVLKTYARENAAAKNFGAINRLVLDKQLVLCRYWSFLAPYFHGVHNVALLLLLMAGSAWSLSGRVSTGEIVAFEGYVGLLGWPIFGLGWGLTMFQRMRASLARIEEILNTPPRKRPPATVRPAIVRGEISIRNLSFSHPAESAGDPKSAPADPVRKVLDAIALEIHAGELLALTGPTGSGKSTLLSLLVALAEPPAGTIFLDGQDVREMAPENLRRHVALVQQMPYLFSRTLAVNLAFGRPEATAEEIKDAVRVGGLEPDVRQFEQGLETLVGDRGITLSGGQRLRVALARALVCDPRVLLLDDVFAAVDVHTEEQIWAALRRRMAGRTVVVVSHRISVLRRCDRVAVIEDGRLSELGRPNELVAGNGFYARSFALQELFEQ
jgi:ATP-binding cassette, subfamily B, multidrug efflux pump